MSQFSRSTKAALEIIGVLPIQPAKQFRRLPQIEFSVFTVGKYER